MSGPPPDPTTDPEASAKLAKVAVHGGEEDVGAGRVSQTVGRQVRHDGGSTALPLEEVRGLAGPKTGGRIRRRRWTATGMRSRRSKRRWRTAV